MPKKFGVNQRSQSAREREEAAKHNAREERERKLEDEKWVENDKLLLKKQQRKDDKESKKREQEARKAEKKAILEAEEHSLTSNAPKKVTHFMIQRELAKTAQRAAKPSSPMYVAPVENEELSIVDLREQNRKLMSSNEVTASGLQSVAESLDKMNITKPPKVTYKEFESRKLPALKQRLSGLRLSQYREMIWNEWKKSPENPKNEHADAA